MGNYTYLTLGDTRCFEAKNILPIPWLALFEPGDYAKESRVEQGETYQVEFFRTTAAEARPRIERAIAAVKGKPISRYLQPLLILQQEIEGCAPTAVVVLNPHQLVAVGPEYEARVREAPALFWQMVASFTGDHTADVARLNEVMWRLELTWGEKQSVASLSSEDLMFALVGFYEEVGTDDTKYPPEYFTDLFWQPIE